MEPILIGWKCSHPQTSDPVCFLPFGGESTRVCKRVLSIFCTKIKRKKNYRFETSKLGFEFAVLTFANQLIYTQKINYLKKKTIWSGPRPTVDRRFKIVIFHCKIWAGFSFDKIKSIRRNLCQSLNTDTTRYI